MQLVIRKYRPSNRAEVHKLFSTGMLEHIYPCFYNAMTTPLYIFITVALSAASVLLGSVLGALVLPGIWVGFIFYCCHQLYSRVLQAKLQTDMQDITRSYLSRPDDCFWGGRSSGRWDGPDCWNGGCTGQSKGGSEARGANQVEHFTIIQVDGPGLHTHPHCH
ncbi:putative N-acetyltransferase CML1 [Takifugu flavidus]|uniref:Putative N-acetyltransferase CML1 n=1 Tax=Takifugu flavidus TaxID=433684 RepID=A0A5C6N587_9TELE|nr:putative N-acetyltransferase CML1 [Takifugu flavidus]